MTHTATLVFRPWRLSRGRDTYGYNLLSAYDADTGKNYRAMGGGYDITGTVFGEWLAATMQAELRKLAEDNRAYYVKRPGQPFEINDTPESLYGVYRREDGSVSIDGACGFSSVQRAAEAAGATVRVIRRPGRAGYVQSITLDWQPV